MVRPWFLPKRTSESTPQQLIATGAFGGYGTDPIDGDTGFQPAGTTGRRLPYWTLEKLRAYSVASYRSNPMARGIIDTYTSFAVGDSGLTLQCSNEQVRVVAQKFWADPMNRLNEQDVALRSHMLNGETVYEMMAGPTTGIVRRSVIDPTRIQDVLLDRGNPLWPRALTFRNGYDGNDTELSVVNFDDVTGLRFGDALYWTSWRAQETDVRGEPFLGPAIDWLDNYDQVLSNLIDRTAIMRYLAFDVTLKGPNQDQNAVNEWIRSRGSNRVPKSGSIEVHNENVEWNALKAETGAFEDTQTAGNVLTQVAAGTGLAKTWLSDPEHANRATSQSMAEPVRRRVGGVQNLWVAYQTQMVRYAVDQAVKAGRLPAFVDATDVSTGKLSQQVPASETVRVTGPEIAASDAQVTAQIVFNLAQGLSLLVQNGIMSPEAASVAAKKAWEEFCGVPWRAELDAKAKAGVPNVVDDIAQAAADAAKNPAAGARLRSITG